jgi:hypothetical protein
MNWMNQRWFLPFNKPMNTNVARPFFGKTHVGGALGLFCLHLWSASALAQAPTVSYAVTGAPGDYTLDFTVENNFSASQYPGSYIYAFGVALGNADMITGSPPGFVNVGEFNPAASGGPNINFFDNWSGGDVPAGGSVSGFAVLYTGATAPISVEWLAYGFVPGGNYSSGASFTGLGDNPGFVDVVPEPRSTLALLGLGLAVLAVFGPNRPQTAKMVGAALNRVEGQNRGVKGQ